MSPPVEEHAVRTPLAAARRHRAEATEDRFAPVVSAATTRGLRLRRVLLLSDLLALALAAAVALLASGAGLGAIDPVHAAVALAVCAPAFFVIAQAGGLYHLSERHLDHTLAEEFWPAFVALTIWSWLTVLALAAAGPAPALGAFGVFWAAALVLMLTGRALARRHTQGRDWYRQNVIVVGDREGNERVLSRLRRHPECGVDPLATVHAGPGGLRGFRFENGSGPEEIRFNGGGPLEEVRDLVAGIGVDRVIVTGWEGGFAERSELIRMLATSGVYVDIVSAEPEALCAGASVHHIEGLPMMTVRPTRMTRTGRAIKRTIDVGAAGPGLLLAAPLFAYLALRIKLDSPGPVFYWQPRAGLDGRHFEMLKFRTMVDGADEHQDELREQSVDDNLFKLREDPRVTRFGKKLRRFSLDELPQLWNVLRGEMSLVGPRPLPTEEAPPTEGPIAVRARVRPGMTGPWQTHGRSDIPYEDMIKLDYMYASSWSLSEDLRLLIRTVGTVLAGRGAY